MITAPETKTGWLGMFPQWRLWNKGKKRYWWGDWRKSLMEKGRVRDKQEFWVLSDWNDKWLPLMRLRIQKTPPLLAGLSGDLHLSQDENWGAVSCMCVCTECGCVVCGMNEHHGLKLWQHAVLCRPYIHWSIDYLPGENMKGIFGFYFWANQKTWKSKYTSKSGTGKERAREKQ